jgi:hypothetical protein
VTDRAAPTQSSPSFTKKQYLEALKAFDAAVCEAIAVSQAAAGIFAPAHKGYATKIFTRVCGYSTALIRAVPRSRWVHSDSEFWDFGSVAGYCRAIFEGQLLLWYVIKQPVSDDEWSARLNVMHLNECSRRIEILGGVLTQAVKHCTDQIVKAFPDAESVRKGLNSRFSPGPTRNRPKKVTRH